MAGQVDDGPSPSTVIAQHTFVDDVPNTEDFLECLNIWWQKPNILLKKCAGAKTTHTEQNYNNRRFVPKRSYNSCSETQVVLSDCDSDRITVRFQPNHDGCAAPIPQMCALPVLQPYEFCFDSDSRCMSLSCKEGSNERSQQFLVSVLFPRVVAWLVAGCRDKGSRRGPRLVAKSLQQVDIETYARTYQRLKKKYADAVKEMWCEKTNPEKFIHEDIGIASYLMTYWSSYRQPKCFVDLGCGNGLLVYLLSSEGYHGYGIDVRRRAIWDKLNVTLREVSLDPSTATLNDADFLIGNHSDELTPWIAVLAARSSEMCEYFVLPCCAHDFYGKFHRKNSNFSVFRDYLDYVQNVGEKFGFRLLADSLRIPSTKRICFTAVRLARKVCTEDEMRAAIMALTENRAQHSGFVTRPAVEPVRNCTALPRLRIDEMVQAIAAELVSRSPSAEDGWRAGGRLLLKECVALLSAEQRTLLRQQCGGVKTLLRNHKHIFAVDARACTATLRDYRTEQSVKNEKTKRSLKMCWFFQNHPDGCPVDSGACNFLHSSE